MLKFLSIVFFLIAINVSGQVNDVYIVNSKTVAMRDKEGQGYKILTTLVKNDAVQLIEKKKSGWWNVRYKGMVGFVPFQFLKEKAKNDQSLSNYQTGDLPSCESETFEYDYNLDNHLKVLVNSNFDVVLKMMKKQQPVDVCIRTVYIQSSDFYLIKNIPQGKYFLKIAYGNNWKQKTIEGECYGFFRENATYEIGKQILNYNVIQLSDRVDVPSYSLSLGVKAKEGFEATFNSFTISEDEFNE